MTKKNILQFIKGALPCLIGEDGNFREEPLGMLQKLNQDRIDLLKDFIKLLMTTNIITRETRIYIKDPYISYRNVSEKINRELQNGEKEVNSNTVSAKIQYDRKKLDTKFGTDFILDMMTQTKSLDKYREKIASAYVTYGTTNTKIRKNLLIDIPSDCVNANVSDEDFESFIDIIKPYIRSQVEFISNNLPQSSCGYFNYLLSNASLTRKDKERLETIKSLLEF